MSAVISVQVGNGAVMSASNPHADPHIEWAMRYGDPVAMRFQAATIIESYDYLLSANINMQEATRRLRILRAAMRNTKP
jgi:hypothetical protein